MANIPCCTSPVTCFDPASPILNLSSEAPDAREFIGTFFGYRPPPLGSLWYSSHCLGISISTISQEDADDAAQRASTECISILQREFVVIPGPVPDPDSFPVPPEPGDTLPLPPPQEPGEGVPSVPGFVPVTTTGADGEPVHIIPGSSATFQNIAQSCDFSCPDGNVFTYTVAAGTFTAFSQVAADTIAFSTACNRVVDNRICIGSMAINQGCVGVDFNQSVSISSQQIPIIVSVVSGVLPLGMELINTDESFTVLGTCNTVGEYAFVVQVEDPDGNFMQKSFTIKIYDIFPSLLDDGILASAYSESLTLEGPAASPITWAVTSGSLPTGLTLNSTTGAITGTPTVLGTFNFTISATF